MNLVEEEQVDNVEADCTVDAGSDIVEDDAEAVVDGVDFVGGPGFEDIEDSEYEESGEEPLPLVGQEGHGHIDAGPFVDDDAFRVFVTGSAEDGGGGYADGDGDREQHPETHGIAVEAQQEVENERGGAAPRGGRDGAESRPEAGADDLAEPVLRGFWPGWKFDQS